MNKDTLNSLRETIASAQAYNRRRTELEQEAASLKLTCSLALDDSTLIKAASLEAGLKLANAIEDRARSMLGSALETARNFEPKLVGAVSDLHTAIDTAIKQKVLNATPDDLRNAVDFRQSKTYLAEIEGRTVPHLSFISYHENYGFRELIGLAAGLAENIEALHREMTRSEKVAKALKIQH